MAPAVPPLTCEEGHVGVFGVIGTPGHATDVVPNGLQRVHLSRGRRGHERCHAGSAVRVTRTRRGVTRGGPRCPHPHGGVTHAVVGADGVEGVGAADEEQVLVPHQQHLDEVPALGLREGTVTWCPPPTPGCCHPGPHRCHSLPWAGVFSPQNGIYRKKKNWISGSCRAVPA